jgi:tRNA threonylcarbamoyladenosine biosynthesis protein TsaB
MKLLAVETATDACSAALFIDGVISECFEIAPRCHTKLVLPMIDRLMSNAGLKPRDLDALAFGRGPGSFTGVRIATAVIQGIAFGADLPVVPVSTLQAIAQDVFDRSEDSVAFTAMDARMDEIFQGVYQRDASGFAELVGIESVTPAAWYVVPDLIGVGCGSGWAVYQQQLTKLFAGRLSRIEADILPGASAIARLGARGFELGLAVSVEQAMPVYIRDQVAKKESERLTKQNGL